MIKQQRFPQESRFTIMAMEDRFYPVSVDKRNDDGSVLLDFLPQCRWEWDAIEGIPYAVGDWPTDGLVSFRTYQEAVEYVLRRDEQFSVWLECKEIAAQCELYPERNAWYVEEIERLVGKKPRVYTLGSDMAAHVIMAGESPCCYAPTLDDVYEKIYQKVYEYVHMHRQTA